MSEKHIDLPLSKLAHGAIQEKLDGELVKVFNNIHDPNTKAKDNRGVTIKLEFTPDENRQTISLTSDFTTKLANVEGVSTTILTGKDLSSGRVEARELQSNAPGQMYMDADDLSVKTDTGTPVDVIEKEMRNKRNKNVLNLQKRESK